MDNRLQLVRLDTDYCNYLREYDNKVPYNYKEKELRPLELLILIICYL